LFAIIFGKSILVILTAVVLLTVQIASKSSGFSSANGVGKL